MWTILAERKYLFIGLAFLALLAHDVYWHLRALNSEAQLAQAKQELALIEQSSNRVTEHLKAVDIKNAENKLNNEKRLQAIREVDLSDDCTHSFYFAFSQMKAAALQ